MGRQYALVVLGQIILHFSPHSFARRGLTGMTSTSQRHCTVACRRSHDALPRPPTQDANAWLCANRIEPHCQQQWPVVNQETPSDTDFGIPDHHCSIYALTSSTNSYSTCILLFSPNHRRPLQELVFFPVFPSYHSSFESLLHIRSRFLQRRPYQRTVGARKQPTQSPSALWLW
jgi:hypothetical protein